LAPLWEQCAQKPSLVLFKRWDELFCLRGAAQLAAIDLMTKNAIVWVVIATGLVINLRFLLYSAAMAPYLKNSGFLVKIVSAHLLTDQSYAVMSANHDNYQLIKMLYNSISARLRV
jgi:predicted branched-subunit amino acid permease